MNEYEDSVDPALRGEFVDESLDGLENVTELLVELEADPDDEGKIQSIFRPVHSIKGNAAFFGLLNTKTLAHELETVLDLVRKGGLAASSMVINVLLNGVDELINILSRVREGEKELLDKAAFDSLISKVRELAGSELADEGSMWQKLLELVALSGNEEMDGLIHKLAKLSNAGRKVLDKDQEAEQNAAANAPESALRLIEIFENEKDEPDSEEVRRCLEECQLLYPAEEPRRELSEALEEVDILHSSIGLGDPVSRECFLDHMKEVIKAGSYTPDTIFTEEDELTDTAPEEEPAPAAETAESPIAAKKDSGGGKTMRIPEESIDAFLSFVGELVIVGEMYTFLQSNLVGGMDRNRAGMELRRINESFSMLSRSLQDSIMNIRKVPMRVIFQRVPRMVRDIAVAEGKKIDISLKGENVMVDKSILDTLEAPLTHMVRNAADHGIEMPDEREKNGKSPEGAITISAEETGDDIILSVIDDGKGLNREALKNKAVELGIIERDQQLTDEDMINILFRSGVSTAEEVSEISGRGVGMDVVKRNIDTMGGNVTVSTEDGKGSVFKVKLPKTVSTQILTGYIVISDKNAYVFPLDRIVRCFRPESRDLVSVKGKGRCVSIGEGFASIIDLSERFGNKRRDHLVDGQYEGIIVLVEGDKEVFAIHVDAIEGVRQVVLKNIEGLKTGLDVFAGGAIMGDGSVAMIIDVDKLIKQA